MFQDVRQNSSYNGIILIIIIIIITNVATLKVCKISPNFVPYDLDVLLTIQRSQFGFKVSDNSNNKDVAWKIIQVLLARSKIF